MTVKQLQEILSQMPPDVLVVIEDDGLFYTPTQWTREPDGKQLVLTEMVSA